MIKHQSPKNESRRATAPYNFVRLPERILEPHQNEWNVEDQSIYTGYSGYFDLTFETSSPLYIRGMLSPEKYAIMGKSKNLSSEEKLEIAKFFSQNGYPVIPGSSLRGMFRTLVEIVSYSKLFAVTDEHYMYRSVDRSSHGQGYRNRLFNENPKNTFFPKFSAGYIVHEGKSSNWFIKPAKEINDVTYARVSHELIQEAGINLRPNPSENYVRYRTVFVKPGVTKEQGIRGGFIKNRFMRVEAISKNKIDDNYIPATLLFSGPMQSKKSEVVIFQADESKTKTKDWISIPETLIKYYKENSIPMFQNKPIAGENGVLENDHPVFYLLEDDKLITFGHCPMMRIPYKFSARELIPEEIRETPFDDLAEGLFGYVKRNNKNQTLVKAGRLFFEDAHWISGPEQKFENDGIAVSPKILSNPKPTTFQHYLVQDSPDDINQLRDFDNDTVIRGNKLYWAKGENPDYFADHERRDVKEGTQYTAFTPLQKGNKFSFRLRFDNLTDVELGALIWIIELGKNATKRLRLGMGKPYGLGAILFTSVGLKIIDRRKRYLSLFTFSPNSEQSCWEDGIDPGTNISDLSNFVKTKFSEWVLSDTTINPGNRKEDIKELGRIKDLLQLLSFNGPDLRDTQYQILQDFRDRKVLPNPIDARFPEVTAQILEINSKLVILDILGIDQESIIGEIIKEDYRENKYIVDDKYLCSILSIRKDPNGDIVYILQPKKRIT